jgi:hypothetical protein
MTISAPLRHWRRANNARLAPTRIPKQGSSTTKAEKASHRRRNSCPAIAAFFSFPHTFPEPRRAHRGHHLTSSCWLPLRCCNAHPPDRVALLAQPTMYIRQDKLPKLKEYKYSGVDHSLVSRYVLKPFYTHVVIKCFPLSMA